MARGQAREGRETKLSFWTLALLGDGNHCAVSAQRTTQWDLSYRMTVTGCGDRVIREARWGGSCSGLGSDDWESTSWHFTPLSPPTVSV